MSEMTLEEWFSELIKVASGDGEAEYIAGTTAADWRDFYEDGYTPEDAWRTEKAYAVQDLG